MSLAPRLDLRQSQSLVMTPQLQQAIRLLALSNLEIETFIAEEVERNPLLESGDDAENGAGDFPAPADEGDEPASGFEEDAPTADMLMVQGSGADDAPLDVDYIAETFHHDSVLDGGLGLSGPVGADAGGDFEMLAGATLSLHDHLVAQAGERLSGADYLIAGYLIDQINAAGYLEATVEEVAELLGAVIADVERVLAVVQSFDPTGVGARTLGECLALQAKEADRYDPCMATMLAHLDLLAAGKLSQLKRLCNVDDEDLADMIRELRSYDPKPGLRFDGGRIETVAPDLFVARSGSEWGIEINSATLPRLLINRRYYLELSSGRGDKESRAWLSECLASANWLVKALDQRQRTIMKVAAELVKQQQAFFTHGVSHLRPLTLRAVAEAIGMHESTVSRVTSNKFLSCGRGMFELKYFFTSAIQAADGGDAVSAEAVKSQIKALVAGEDPRKILSDDTLVDLLRGKGFDIARRTVAKYREALGIGSSVQRRRQKAIQGKAA